MTASVVTNNGVITLHWVNDFIIDGSFFSAVDLMISGLKRAKEPAGEGPSAQVRASCRPSVAKISVSRQINSR